MITVQRGNAASATSTPKGVQFLSPRHITKAEGHIAKVTKVTTPDNGGKPDNFGNPYVVYFLMEGTRYSKGFKPTSDALAQLVDLLGADEKKWSNASIRITKTVDDDGGERLAYLKAGK